MNHPVGVSQGDAGYAAQGNRAFFPPVFGYPFAPFPFAPFPFFPGRRFFPFFGLYPFGFPFWRGEEDRDGTYFHQHHCQHGETMESLAERYNVPTPILETMNPHIQSPAALTAGTVAYIPRMHKMQCHRMYMEQPEPEAVSPAETYPNAVSPAAAYPNAVSPAAAYPNAVSPAAAYPNAPNVPHQQAMPYGVSPFSAAK